MPRTKMSPNPELQQTYYRFNIYQAQSCSGEAEKVANMRRILQALKEEKQAFLRTNTRLGRLNKGILAARLIRETSYSFLDLTAAFAGDILNKADPTGLSGKKVNLVATMGMGAIDMTEASMAAAYGHGSWGNVIETGVKSGLNIAEEAASGISQKSYVYLGKQKMNVYRIGKGSLASDQNAVKDATGDMAFESMSFILDMTKENVTDPIVKTGITGLKSAIKTIKASRRYGRALDAALEEYRTSAEDTRRSREVMTAAMERSITHADDALNKAQQAYDRCMRPGGPFPLG